MNLDMQAVIQQVLAQAGSVVVLVALLRLAVRRVFNVEPDADALLGLNLLANLLITLALLLQAGADFLSMQTYGTLALVALGATVIAHGGYDLVASRAKGGSTAPSQAPAPEGVDMGSPASDPGGADVAI